MTQVKSLKYQTEKAGHGFLHRIHRAKKNRKRRSREEVGKSKTRKIKLREIRLKEIEHEN